MEAIIPILVVVGIATVGVFSYLANKKRREALFTWSAQKGWRMRTHGVKYVHRNYPFLKVFDKGHSRQSSNVIEGDIEGHPLVLMDYQYVTGSGKNCSTHNFGLVILQLPHAVLPLSIRRESVFDKVGEFFGGGDIDFESSEFSRKFYVTSSDRKWAYDVIHPRVMDYLLTAPPHSVCYGGHEIAIMKKGQFNLESYDEAIVMAAELHRLMPDFLVQQMKSSK